MIFFFNRFLGLARQGGKMMQEKGVSTNLDSRPNDSESILNHLDQI